MSTLQDIRENEQKEVTYFKHNIHHRTVLQSSSDKFKCILFCQLWRWNSVTTHLNALTIRLWSSGTLLDPFQKRFSSHALDQAILWPLNETDSPSSSSSWLTYPAGIKWILPKASRTCREVGKSNEWIYPKPSNGSSTPLVEAPFYMVQFWKTSTLERKASFHSN